MSRDLTTEVTEGIEMKQPKMFACSPDIDPLGVLCTLCGETSSNLIQSIFCSVPTVDRYALPHCIWGDAK